MKWRTMNRLQYWTGMFQGVLAAMCLVNDHWLLAAMNASLGVFNVYIAVKDRRYEVLDK